MATVKKANVPPTHPTVWIGLALAVVGLLLATFAYTGARVYDILFAFIALLGAFLALAGILVAAWGRSIMAARASRSRRAGISQDALALARPVGAGEAMAEMVGSEDVPTVAASKDKKRFAFGVPKRKEKEAREREKAPRAVFAFQRREPAREPERAMVEPAGSPHAADDPRNPEVSVRLAPETPAPPVRVTLRCPQCSTTFSAEGVRPFSASCGACGFSATV